MKLFKVFVYTQGHPHVSEMIVAATSEADAEARALNHVKRSNPTKGERTPDESRDRSVARSIQETGIDGCLVVNKLALKACRDMGMTFDE